MKYKSIFLRWMLLTAVFAGIQYNAFSQSKVYISAGLVGTTGGPDQLFRDYENMFGYKHISVDWEERIVGSFYLLTGLSYYDIGYKSESRSRGSAIEFKGSYLSVPILARWNVKNLNIFYLDLGLSPSYLVYASGGKHYKMEFPENCGRRCHAPSEPTLYLLPTTGDNCY